MTDINREAAKISALSSRKNDKYEYLTGFFILPSNQRKVIEQDKFTYFPLGKAFEKQIKAIEEQGKKTNQKQLKNFRSFKIREKKRKYKINGRNFAKRSEN